MGGRDDDGSGGAASATAREGFFGHADASQDAQTVHEQPAVGRHEVPDRIPVEEYHAYYHADRWGPADRPLRGSGDADRDLLSADERLVYEVDVRESGVHEVAVRIAGAEPFGGGKLGISIGGERIARYAIPPTGGWDEWKTNAAMLELPRGVHDLTLDVLQGGWKLDWIEIR